MDRIKNPKVFNVYRMNHIAKTMNPKDSDVYRNSTRNRYDPEGVAPQATAFFYKHQIPFGIKNKK